MPRGIRHLVPPILFWLIIMPANAQVTATRPRVDFATYLSGSLDTTVVGLAIDPKGYMYVTGLTSDGDFPTTAGAFRRTPRRVCSNGSCFYSTAFVSKLSRDGSSLVYSTFLNEIAPLAIAVDNEGNAYMTGFLVDTDYTGTTGTWRTKCRNTNGSCRWIVKLNTSGSGLLYSTLIDDVRECFTGGDQRIAVNAENEVYVAGTAAVFNVPASGPPPPCYTTANAFRSTVSGDGSGTVVMKFTADAKGLLFSTWVSGPAPQDQFYGLAVTGNDRAVITGTAFNSDFPTGQSAFQRTEKGSYDVFVAKLSPDGSTLLASTLLGGSSIDQPGGVAVDVEGNVYVAGITDSTDFPTTVGAYRTTLNPTGCPETKGDGRRCYDIFVSKIPPDFTRLQFSTFLGGNGDDRFPPQVAVDGVGHVYVTGVPGSLTLSPPGHPLFKPIQSEWRELYVTKLNIEGSELLFSTYFGGTLDAEGVPQSVTGLKVDQGGNAYVALNTTSTNFPTTANAYQTFNHSGDAAGFNEAGFLAKFDIPPCTLSSETPSITICAPASGATAQSPVLVAAGATDDHTITGMILYVDGVRKFSITNNSHFDKKVSLPSGSHRLTVKAWNTAGRIISKTENVSVQ
jgi:hypothetical protein